MCLSKLSHTQIEPMVFSMSTHLLFSYLFQMLSNFLPLYCYHGFSTMQRLSFHHLCLPFLCFYFFLAFAQTFKVCSVLDPLLRTDSSLTLDSSFHFFLTCLLPFSEPN